MLKRIPTLKTFRYGLAYRAARRAFLAKDWPRAAKLYEVVVSFGLHGARDWVQYGHALKEAGELEAAERAYAEAVAIEPHAEDTHRQLGFFLKLLGRNEAAGRVFLRGLCVHPEEVDLEAELERYGFAGEKLRLYLLIAALEIGGPSVFERRRAARGRNNRQLAASRRAAAAATREYRWLDAAGHYRAMLMIEPCQPEILVQLGHALKESGDRDAARHAYQTAISWAPYDPDPHLHLGHVMKLKGDRDASVHAYLTAWRMRPGFDGVERELLDYVGWDQEKIRGFAAASWSIPSDRIATSISSPQEPAITQGYVPGVDAEVRETRLVVDPPPAFEPIAPPRQEPPPVSQVAPVELQPRTIEPMFETPDYLPHRERQIWEDLVRARRGNGGENGARETGGAARAPFYLSRPEQKIWTDLASDLFDET